MADGTLDSQVGARICNGLAIMRACLEAQKSGEAPRLGALEDKHQMTKKRKHSKAEIAAKLAEAEDLATQGKLQSEIARALGVSVMTLHHGASCRRSRTVRAKSIRRRRPDLPNSNSKIRGCGDW